MALAPRIRFWLYLVPLVPSILCSIFVLHRLLVTRALRTAPNNHVVILILSFGLLYEITDVVWYIDFYRMGAPLSATPAFCLTWIFIDVSVYVTITLLMAWASIERHILVFHPNWIGTTTACFFIHYLPMLICCVYPATFYAYMFFVEPCALPFDYTMTTCYRYPCVGRRPRVALWDSVVHNLLPIFIIVTFSMALLARVLYYRCRAHGRIAWRNYRKMSVQLLSISAIYFVFLLPPMAMYAAYTAGVSWKVASNYFSVALYFTYYTVLLTPFVCAVSLPTTPRKLKQLTFLRGRRAIGPVLVAPQIAVLTPLRY